MNDVWKSDNLGATWSICTSSASWPGRLGHSSVVIDTTIYLMGGSSSYDSSTNCK